jgi:hypothetical protein
MRDMCPACGATLTQHQRAPHGNTPQGTLVNTEGLEYDFLASISAANVINDALNSVEETEGGDIDVAPVVNAVCLSYCMPR